MTSHNNPRPHASLWIVAGLAMGPAVALGLARFAYALLLPAMRTDLSWSYADAGAMNTANAAGYLAGALIAAPIARRIGIRQTFLVGIAVTAASVGASALTPQFALQAGFRMLAGLAGALAFVAGGSMAAAASGSAARAPLALGIYFAGGGLGVAMSALTVPLLLDTVGWRGGWLVLAALAAAAGVIALPALLRAPLPADQSPSAHDSSWSPRRMAIELLGYVLFGAGYIAYATFIIAQLRSGSNFSAREVSLFWALLGCAAMAGVFVWSPILARLRGGRGASAVIAVVALGAALPLISGSRAMAYMSALLFGGSFLSTITAVTSFARRAAPPAAWTKAIAALTVAFGIGQCVGPILSGYLSDGPHGVRTGLQVSVAVLLAAAVLIAFQREPGAGVVGASRSGWRENH
ncbi:MAG TPA: YbfB/YjiJ family MFS transporter [Steroidobacteraceae bacterium]|jgi:predicted MFS family arabinose efflux permease|nr:YbfB/YjiJ family MFS transporter [Steroidobacteraceae bacterium]